MTQETKDQDWLETIPTKLKPIIQNLQHLADLNMKNGSPYHSIRVVAACFELAGNDAGRLPAWCLAVTTQKGWEHDNTVFDQGTMWMMFKNPYVFH